MCYDLYWGSNIHQPKDVESWSAFEVDYHDKKGCVTVLSTTRICTRKDPYRSTTSLDKIVFASKYTLSPK